MKKIRKQRRIRKSRSRVAVLNFQRIYLLLFFVIVSSLALYLYFLFASIYYTSLAKNTRFQLSKLNSEISSLEADYVQVYESIDSAELSDSFVKLSAGAKEFVNVDTVLGRAN